MVHRFVCDKCQEEIFDTNTKIIHQCPKCGKDMYWDLNNGTHSGEHGFWSTSMGVPPYQIPDEMKRHPDWTFSPDGKLWCRGSHDQERKAKELGMEVG